MTDKLNLGPRRGLAVVRPGDPSPRRDHVLAVDGRLAPVMPVELPAKLRGAARLRVAQRQIADRLGLASDDIAVLPAGKGHDWTRVCMVDRETLAGWADTASGRCRAIVPDYMTLPDKPGHAVMTAQGENILARLGPANGVTVPLGAAEAVLFRALEADGLRAAVVTDTVPKTVTDALVSAGVDLIPATLNTAGVAKPALDLRDALRTGEDTGALRVWFAAAALAFLAFGLWAAGLMIETRAIDDEAAKIRAETEEVLRQGLIPSGPLLDVREQVARALAARAAPDARDDMSGLALFSQVSLIVFERGIGVDAVELDETALRLSVNAQDFALAEALQDDFVTEGFDATTEVLRAREDGRVEARFRLERDR